MVALLLSCEMPSPIYKFASLVLQNLKSCDFYNLWVDSIVFIFDTLSKICEQIL